MKKFILVIITVLSITLFASVMTGCGNINLPKTDENGTPVSQ